MHQPFYKDLESNEFILPWVRLHAIKDYFDMVKILEDFPKIKLTFNLVPSLLEQLNDYVNGVQDYFQKISMREIKSLSDQERQFVLDNFFSINVETVISSFPRYLQLFKQKQAHGDFSDQDIEDLIALFNISWFDPYFRENFTEIDTLIKKARYFDIHDRKLIIDKQLEALKMVLPIYKEFQEKKQIEIIFSPYYHPILPLLVDNTCAKEANSHVRLPRHRFSYVNDALMQIEQGKAYLKETLGCDCTGMWPSELSVSEAILPLVIKNKIDWLIADEDILFSSLKKKRNAKYLYRPYRLERKDGILNIIFRDKHLSDLIGFQYKERKAKDAASDFLTYLENINKLYKKQDTLVVVALDGENAWEYYKNDGWDFLKELYSKLSEADFIKSTLISDYLKEYPPKENIPSISTGSWIYANFNKWIGSSKKNLAWDYLAKARKLVESLDEKDEQKLSLIYKQLYILEGSDWFWWFDEANLDFDRLFRLHLTNLYKYLGETPPKELSFPLKKS